MTALRKILIEEEPVATTTVARAPAAKLYVVTAKAPAEVKAAPAAAAILKVAKAPHFGDSQITGKMIHGRDGAFAIPSGGFESRLRRLSGPA